jgi:hypothetical protein
VVAFWGDAETDSGVLVAVLKPAVVFSPRDNGFMCFCASANLAASIAFTISASPFLDNK